MTDMIQFKAEFSATIIEVVAHEALSVGFALKADLREAGDYAAERAAHLSGIVAQAGYFEAVAAERDNVALKFAINAVHNADEVDDRIKSAIQGSLATGARIMALALLG